MRAVSGVGAPPEAGAGDVFVEFCGEWYPIVRPGRFSIGRDADLIVDDNPFLHRRLLEIVDHDGIWLLCNIGSRLAITVTDGLGRVQSWLAPGARLPLVFGRTTVVFTAGPTTYEIAIHLAEPTFSETAPVSLDGTTTIGDVSLTDSQRLLILALAEPMLAIEGGGRGEIPTSLHAAQRLGWAITRFNRKLDNVCDKLDRLGVQGLRGGVATGAAVNRRVRLVEYAVAARLVTRADLPLLQREGAHP